MISLNSVLSHGENRQKMGREALYPCTVNRACSLLKFCCFWGNQTFFDSGHKCCAAVLACLAASGSGTIHFPYEQFQE